MTGLAADPICKEHVTGPQHPEQPARFDAAVGALRGLDLVPIPPRLATHDELALCHSRKYIQLAEREIFEGFHELSTGDTTISPKSLDAALRATGQALNAVDAIFDKRISNAFVIGRPPGHHAETARPMGFCLFDNAAIAARHAQNRHGIDRVAIVDFDVHHGNGSQEIFWSDKTVMYCSTHQMPLFPGTGAVSESGEYNTVVNAPLRPGDGTDKFRDALESRILPRLIEFRPELVIISAGFDAHYRDPLANINLEEADFAWATQKLMEVADRYAGGRVVSLLVGGYDLQGLGNSVAAHVTALMRG